MNVNVTELVTLAGAMAGMGTVLVALWKLRRVDEARLALDARNGIIDQLQEEYQRLTLSNDRLQKRVDALSSELDQTQQDRAVLRQRLDELVQENQKLHQYIGALSERIKARIAAPQAAVDRMQLVGQKVAELHTYACMHYSNESIADHVTDLFDLVTGIPALVDDA